MKLKNILTGILVIAATAGVLLIGLSPVHADTSKQVTVRVGDTPATLASRYQIPAKQMSKIKSVKAGQTLVINADKSISLLNNGHNYASAPHYNIKSAI